MGAASDVFFDPGRDQRPGPADGQLSEIAAAKALWRLHLRSLRLARAALVQDAILGRARRQLLRWLPPGQRLGLYWPLTGEIDLRRLADHRDPAPGPAPAGSSAGSTAGRSAKRLADRLALPAVAGEADAWQLEYRAWQPGEPLVPDRCRIPAPQGPPLDPGQLGLLLVPAVGCDRQGFRLGSGGGWYDRLRSDPAWRAIPALAVLPALCVVDRLPCDPWDVPFSGWLDENGIHVLPGSGLSPLGSPRGT